MPSKILKALALGMGAFAANLHGQTSEPSAPDLAWGVQIPMHDGVTLNATIYRPHGSSRPLPVVFTFTPYISDSYHARGMYFAQHGYVYALVDVRGRGNSKGQFDPFRTEGADGAEVVEWFAKQPWSNGKVAMWGGSYAGFDQWAVAKEFPPHLATIVPAASGHPGVDFPHDRNVFAPYIVQWLTFTSGVTGQGNLFGDAAFWNAKFWDLYSKHLPFRSLDSLVGNPSSVFQTWVSHPARDTRWTGLNPSPEQHHRLTIPVLTITGAYDDDQLGALTYYKEHIANATPEARARHYLIIGPWDHAGTRTPSREVGGVQFGEASLLDLNQLHVAWYDWTMKQGPRPSFLSQRVAYYLMGAEEWRFAGSLDEIATGTLQLFLQSAGLANDLYASGSLAESRPASSLKDSYVYDPLDLRPGARELTASANYLTDQADLQDTFGNGLIYHTAPFPAATEITGQLKLTVWLSMDVPDTDIQATVYEILPDGRSIRLTQDRMRARYRTSFTTGTLVRPGVAERYDFEGFTFFSRQIAKGSRLRLFIRSPNSIGLEKNYNAGGVVAEESGKDARTAHITLYHDSEHPSKLEVPIVRR